MLGYLWDTSFHNENYEEHWKDIYKMPIVKEYLKEFITEVHNIQGPSNILWEEDKKSDLVLIYRKK